MEEKPGKDTIATATPTGGSRVIRRNPPGGGTGKKRLNWPYLVLSLFIGTLLWFGVDLKRMKEVTLDVEVAYDSHLPADWKFVSPPQRAVRVVLRGPNQEVSNLRREEITLEPEYPKAALDGDAYDGGLTLLPAHVQNLPAGIDVLSVNPPIIPIRLSKIITRYLTVEAGEIEGTPQDGYAFGRVHSIDPPAMSISASREFLSKITSTDVIHTLPFNVDGGKGLVGGMIGLKPFEKDGEVVNVSGHVYMTVELDEVPAEKEIDQPFEVRALVDSPFDRYGKLNLSPPSVKVTVAGPKMILDKLNPAEIIIYADMRDRIPAATGEFNIKCKAVTPSRVRVVRIEPDTVKWLVRDEAPAASEPRTAEAEAGR
jgi:hypothetical protein